MSKENIGKIYSRRRFLLNPQFNSVNNQNNTSINKSKTTQSNVNAKNSEKNLHNTSNFGLNLEGQTQKTKDVGLNLERKTQKTKDAGFNAGGKTASIRDLGVKKNETKKKLRKKIIKLIIIAVLLMLILQLFFYYFEPIFEAMCEEKVKSLATIITNQQSTIVMNKYQYEELYTIEKDANGNIVIIKSNVVPINNMISELTENIQNEFDKIEDPTVNIALGNLSGIYFLSGSGPEIPIEVSITGTVDTEIKSEFIAQGINQTLHRVYVDFECNMQIVTPLKNYNKKVTNQVIIAEHVIVGNIPNSYYNLEGIESDMDTLNVIE